MAKTRKYFRKHTRHNKKTYNKKRHNKSHKKHKKTRMRRNKKLHKSKKYKLRGGGSFPYLPQDLVNTWWGAGNDLNNLMNNWKGLPGEEGPLPTDQPQLLRTPTYYPTLPDLDTINESVDLQVNKLITPIN